MPYNIDEIRKKIKDSQSGKFNDPDEFKPPKATSDSVAMKYKFFILPPLRAGDVIKSGTVTKSMEQYYIPHGNHWLDNKPHPCPRVYSGGVDDCEVCSFGFELLKDDKVKGDDAKRQAIIGQWMPASYNMMNIYFPNTKDNPEELRNRVMFYNAPKTIIDKCNACLMSDNAGDEESPEAFGIFYDENNAYKFELQSLKKGKNNSYVTSKFMSKPTPLVKDEAGNPVTKAIDTILKLRHNLFAKIQAPDPVKISKAFKLISSGTSDSNGGFDNDEDTTENTRTSNKTKEQPKEQPKAKSNQVLEDETMVEDSDERVIESNTKVNKTKESVAATAKDDDNDDYDAETLALMAQLSEE